MNRKLKIILIKCKFFLQLKLKIIGITFLKHIKNKCINYIKFYYYIFNIMRIRECNYILK